MVRLYLSYIKAEDAYRRQDLLASCSTTVSPNDQALSPHTGPRRKPRSSLPRRLVDVALLFTSAVGQFTLITLRATGDVSSRAEVFQGSADRLRSPSRQPFQAHPAGK
jgi:hypothetical protein